MTMYEPPLDEVLCRFVRMARLIGKCVHIVVEDDQWCPTEDDASPRKSVTGDYYEVFPTGGRIQRRQMETHMVMDEVWWSDLMMRRYSQERAEVVLETA